MAGASTKQTMVDHEQYRVLDAVCDFVTVLEPDLTIVWANRTAKRLFGDDLVGRPCYAAIHGREKPCEPSPCLCVKAFADGRGHGHETRVRLKDGREIDVSCKANVLERDARGRPVRVIEVSRDITQQRRAEKALKAIEASLQERVRQCTTELDAKNTRLSDANTALRVLTRNLQNEQEALQENFLANIKRNVTPYIARVKKTPLSPRQRTLVQAVERNLREITSNFTLRLESRHTGLTAQEIRIAELIRLGNTSKDISNILDISPNTVDTHRRNIRKKLGCNGSGESLRTRLMAIG